MGPAIASLELESTLEELILTLRGEVVREAGLRLEAGQLARVRL